MTKTKQIYNNLPLMVKTILVSSRGWLVGSAVDKILKNEKVKDYDIIIDDNELYQKGILLLSSSNPDSMTINTFGGLKFKFKEVEIDIWPSALDHFLKTVCSAPYIYNLDRQLIYKLDQ